MQARPRVHFGVRGIRGPCRRSKRNQSPDGWTHESGVGERGPGQSTDVGVLGPGGRVVADESLEAGCIVRREECQGQKPEDAPRPSTPAII